MNYVRHGLVITAISFAAFATSAGIHEEPDGAAVKLTPDGGFQVTAIASGEYLFNNPTAIRNARASAEKRAKAALAKFLKEDISTKEGMDEATKNTLKLSNDGQSETQQATMESVSSTMESIKNSANALLTGVIVLEDEKIPSGNGGSYRVKVGVSSKTTAAAGKAAVGMNGVHNGNGQGDGSVNTGAVPQGGSVSGAASSPAGLPEGWIVCIGYGADRKRAVQAALVEGIGQVYGQALSNDERMSERMASLQSNMSILGKNIDIAMESNVQATMSETVTKTAGFVREFRVVAVVEKDGNKEATVHANIVNPRAGGTMALMVCKPTMLIKDRTTVYQLGPKTRMSGAEVADAVQFALPNGLAKANRFIILNDKSLKAVIENNVTTKAMVATGLAGAQELSQIGQGITPDYSLRSEITEINYSKKLGKDSTTGKFGSLYKMVVKIKVSLTNDRNGQLVKSDAITLSLDNEEIKGLLEADEDADLLQAALSKLAEPIEAWMGK